MKEEMGGGSGQAEQRRRIQGACKVGRSPARAEHAALKVLPRGSLEQEDSLALISTIHLRKSSWQAGGSVLQCELLLTR